MGRRRSVKPERQVTLVRPHVLRTKGAATGAMYELRAGKATPVPEIDLKPMLRKWAARQYIDRPVIRVTEVEEG